MNRGRFSKFRQKRYTSSTGRLMVTLSSTLIPSPYPTLATGLARSLPRDPAPPRAAFPACPFRALAISPVATGNRKGRNRLARKVRSKRAAPATPEISRSVLPTSPCPVAWCLRRFSHRSLEGVPLSRAIGPSLCCGALVRGYLVELACRLVAQAGDP